MRLALIGYGAMGQLIAQLANAANDEVVSRALETLRPAHGADDCLQTRVLELDHLAAHRALLDALLRWSGRCSMKSGIRSGPSVLASGGGDKAC